MGGRIRGGLFLAFVLGLGIWLALGKGPPAPGRGSGDDSIGAKTTPESAPANKGTSSRLLPLSSPRQPSEDAPVAHHLQGRVISVWDGAGMSGLEVVVVDAEDEEHRTATDLAGRFVFSELPPGEAHVWPAATERRGVPMEGDATPQRVGIGPETPSVQIRWLPPRQVRLTVVFESHRPASDFEIRREDQFVGRTDAEGQVDLLVELGDVLGIKSTEVWKEREQHARLEKLRELFPSTPVRHLADYGLSSRLLQEGVRSELRVEVEHMLSAEAHVTVPYRDARGPEPGVWHLAGRVIDGRTGVTLNDVEVLIQPSDPSLPSSRESCRPGYFHHFTMADELTVSADHPEYGAARLVGIFRHTEEVELRLEVPGRLEVVVVDGGGRPVPAYMLRWGVERGDLELRWMGQKGVLDPLGRFVLPRVAPGSYVVEAQAREWAPARVRRVRVGVHGTGRARIELETPGSVVGVVTSDGVPLPGAQVELEGFGGTEKVESGLLGDFILTGLAPGRRSLVAEAEGHRRRIVGALDVQTGERLGPISIPLTPRVDDEDSSLDFVGIGAVLKAQADGLSVQEVLNEGGAALAGLRPGDRILAIDGTEIERLGFDAGIQAIRGEAGTTVQLTVEGPEGIRIVAVERLPTTT